jgi:hypothetical protein
VSFVCEHVQHRHHGLSRSTALRSILSTLNPAQAWKKESIELWTLKQGRSPDSSAVIEIRASSN